MRLSSCNTKQLLKVRTSLQTEVIPTGAVESSRSPQPKKPDSKYRFVTGRETAQILSLYEQGLAASEVGRRVDRPLRTVTDALRRNGVAIRKHTPLTDSQAIAETVRLYESGLSCAGIAKVLGLSRSCVGKHLQNTGVTMRSKSEAAILRSKRGNA